VPPQPPRDIRAVAAGNCPNRRKLPPFCEVDKRRWRQDCRKERRFTPRHETLVSPGTRRLCARLRSAELRGVRLQQRAADWPCRADQARTPAGRQGAARSPHVAGRRTLCFRSREGVRAEPARRPGKRGQKHPRLAGGRDALSRLCMARVAPPACPATRSTRVSSPWSKRSVLPGSKSRSLSPTSAERAAGSEAPPLSAVRRS
jgi:hypothetical protein